MTGGGDQGARPRTRPQPVELRTTRLVLRRWREDDLAPFRELNADPEVMRYFAGPLSGPESDTVAHRIVGLFEQGLGPWAVEVAGETSFVGFVGCWAVRPDLPFAPAIEVAWRLARQFWRRGIASEAAVAALDDVFGRGGHDEVVAYTAAGNGPSRAVMDRLGMIRAPGADFLHPVMPEGHPHRLHVLYRLRRESFLSGRAAP